MLQISVRNTKLKFRVQTRDDIYDYLKKQLYPLHPISDKQFKFDMATHMGTNGVSVDAVKVSTMTNGQITDALQRSGYLEVIEV